MAKKTGKPPADGPGGADLGEFNACRAVLVSDGLTERAVLQVDTTVPFTEADQAAVERAFQAQEPKSRIMTLRANLTAIGPTTNPHVVENAERIIRILHVLRRLSEDVPSVGLEWLDMSVAERLASNQRWEDAQPSKAELLKLDGAEALWEKIVLLLEKERKAKSVSKKNSDRKAGTRVKDVSKKQIEAFRVDFEREHDNTHGWKAAAARHFKVDTKTIRSRLDEES